jgi:hypothetical protein
MSKKKVKPVTDKGPLIREWLAETLIKSARAKRAKGVEHKEQPEHNHDDHKTAIFYIAMVKEGVVREVVNVDEKTKNLLMSEPTMIELLEEKWPTRPTIGWKWDGENFIA